MELEEAKEDLRRTRVRQKANAKVSLSDLQREYDLASLDLAAAQARLTSVQQKVREKIPESEAKFKPGDRVWVAPLRLYGTVRRVLGFSILNNSIGALYEVESCRSEVYHELLLREATNEAKTG
jgi:hypothetical protein